MSSSKFCIPLHTVSRQSPQPLSCRLRGLESLEDSCQFVMLRRAPDSGEPRSTLRDAPAKSDFEFKSCHISCKRASFMCRYSYYSFDGQCYNECRSLRFLKVSYLPDIHCRSVYCHSNMALSPSSLRLQVLTVGVPQGRISRKTYLT